MTEAVLPRAAPLLMVMAVAEKLPGATPRLVSAAMFRMPLLMTVGPAKVLAVPDRVRVPRPSLVIPVVPVLLILALILVVVGPRIQAWAQNRAEKAGRSADNISAGRMAVLVLSTFAIGVYGGYFTAAQGILMVGVMGALLPESIQRMNAAKNLLILLVNVVAALAFTLVAFHRINWSVAGLISIGSAVGGWLGVRYGRRLSPNALRAIIVVVGLIGLYRVLAL